LGTLHKDKRVVDYYPQDERLEFSTRPQIMGKGGPPAPGEPDYNYETGGLSYTQRVPQNLLGSHAKAERSMVDTVNDRLMLEKLKEATGQGPVGMPPPNAFPKTTNQDFHNDDVFDKAAAIGRNVDKQNFKKVNVYSSYVNAMFNSGVFTNPWQDQC